MLELIAQNMSIFWIALVIIFAVVEALDRRAHLHLVWLWARWRPWSPPSSARPSGCNSLWFFIISIASLLLTRPLVRKYVDTVKQPTNADMVIGKTALVTEGIDNIAAAGAVTVGGKVWTARSAGGDPIARDSIVVVKRIEGVKLIVEPAPAADDKTFEQEGETE